MPSPATPADQPADAPAGTGQDDVKRRFKEALDRKHGRQGEAAAGADGGHAKVHGGAHGPAQQQRQFRRKSG